MTASKILHGQNVFIVIIVNWSSYARSDAIKLMLIISKINSSWDSLTCQSRNVWFMRRISILTKV